MKAGLDKSLIGPFLYRRKCAEKRCKVLIVKGGRCFAHAIRRVQTEKNDA